MDIFDILGPVMVGPSSSHTAGAARIGKMARTLLGGEPMEARIHLHGSFAETGSGHGTDRALVAGLLGMNPDDMRIPFAFQEAEKAGLHFTVDKIDLRDAHPNTAVIEVRDAHGKQLELQAASIGGGRIVVISWTALTSASPETTTRWWSATTMKTVLWPPSPPSSASCGSTWPI